MTWMLADRRKFPVTGPAFAAASVLMAMPAPALASTVAYAADQNGRPTAVDHITLVIPVSATVEPACTALNPERSTVDLQELARPLPTASIGLTIRCNSAFRMAVVSHNGGLKSPLPAPEGYTNIRDYRVALQVTDDSNHEHVSATCNASALSPTAANSDCATSLRGPASGGASTFLVGAPSNDKPSYLRISDAPAPAGILVSGTGYEDALTITLSAAT